MTRNSNLLNTEYREIWILISIIRERVEKWSVTFENGQSQRRRRKSFIEKIKKRDDCNRQVDMKKLVIDIEELRIGFATERYSLW